MANPIVLLDATMTIGPSTFDISPWLKKLELKDTFEAKKTTNFRSGGAEENKGGLESFEAALTLNQDYDAAALDEAMWALRRATVTFAARAQQSAVTSSNPQYSGKLVVVSWVPISGSVGDVGEVDVTFPGSGPLARATAT
jgi:hypothetical protein